MRNPGLPSRGARPDARIARAGRVVRSTLECAEAHLSLPDGWLNLLDASETRPESLEQVFESHEENATRVTHRRSEDFPRVTRVRLGRDGHLKGTLFLAWDALPEEDIDETLVVDVTDTVVDILEAERSRRRTRMLIDLVPHAIVIEMADGERVLTNRAYEDYLQEASEAGVESLRDIIDIDLEELAEEGMRREVRTVETGDGERVFEVAMQLYREWRVGNDAVMAVMTDLTEIERSEEEIRRKQRLLEAANAELERSNQELEQFAYIASHDLQEPLRMVSSFLSLLVEEYGEQLDEEAEEYVEFAVDGARRMKMMVDELLEFSRMRTSDTPFLQVDVGELVDNAIQEIHDNHPDTSVGFVVESLPVLHARPAQLRRVFTNLLINAVKHSGAGDLTVRVDAEEREDDYLFTVADTGTGVPDQQKERIFDIFVRGSRGGDSDEGTGIRLAVCATVVAKHGGRIWVEDVDPHGAAFKFTISKELAHGQGQ